SSAQRARRDDGSPLRERCAILPKEPAWQNCHRLALGPPPSHPRCIALGPRHPSSCIAPRIALLRLSLVSAALDSPAGAHDQLDSTAESVREADERFQREAIEPPA